MKMGLLGKTLKHTLSPRIHQKIFAYLGRTGEYAIYEKKPEELQSFVLSAAKEGLTGFNVTIPYKTRVMGYLDKISAEAKNIGAVNTVHVVSGRLIGYNTDYFGFGYTLRKAGIDAAGKKVCLLGSGGAAKAVAVYLKDAGAREVVIISRDTTRAKAEFKEFSIKGYDAVKGDILVNTTPVGMFPDIAACPLDKSAIAGFGAVADIVYKAESCRRISYKRRQMKRQNPFCRVRRRTAASPDALRRRRR